MSINQGICCHDRYSQSNNPDPTQDKIPILDQREQFSFSSGHILFYRSDSCDHEVFVFPHLGRVRCDSFAHTCCHTSPHARPRVCPSQQVGCGALSSFSLTFNPKQKRRWSLSQISKWASSTLYVLPPHLHSHPLNHPGSGL